MNSSVPEWGVKIVGVIALVSTWGAGLLLAENEQQSTATPTTASTAEPTLRVGGEVPAPLGLTLSDLARMPRTEVRVKDHGGSEVIYSGVSLRDVLRAAGLQLGVATMQNRDVVVSYVLVEAADGYRAVFALAELDPAESDRVILLADRKNGQLLPAGEGPFRVVVPDEKLPARWVRQVRTIRVGRP
jgi:DMSO/TMAO reductase YedYZ molybdopterin-dependent catalytic subunit